MQHRRPDPTRQYPAHQLDAEAFASEIMAKPLSVRRSLNAQGLGKPEMVPCSKFYSDGHAWVVDRQGPVEHRAHCGARIICEIISNGIWVGHATSDDDVRIPALDPFHAAKNDPKMERSEESRVGKGCVSTCRSRRSQ